MVSNPMCPVCKTQRLVPIFYGYPAPDSMEGLLAAAEAGEVVLGGCLVTHDDPQWACKRCGKEWRERELRPRQARQRAPKGRRVRRASQK